MALARTPLPATLALALALGSVSAAQAPEERSQVRILVLQPAASAKPEGFDELVGTLRVIVGSAVAIDVVGASIPARPPERWGASVARSEGADGVVWLAPGVASGRSVMWVIRIDGAGETAERFELTEPRTFDRMRALALGARPLLEPLLERAEAEAPANAISEAQTNDAQPSETGPAAGSENGPTNESENGPTDGSENGPTDGNEPGPTDGRESAPPDGQGSVEPTSPPPGRTTDGESSEEATSAHPAVRRAPLKPRLALGATVRNEGVLGARLVGELAFLERGWAHVSGDLMRAEQRTDGRPDGRADGRPDGRSARQRAQAFAFAGAELEWGRLRARLGAGVGVTLAWPEGQSMASGFVLAAMGALAIRLGPELFLSIPLTLEGVVARPAGAAIPGWQGSIGLLLGIAP